MTVSRTSNTSKLASPSTTDLSPAPWQAPTLKPNYQLMLEKLAAVKHRLKADAAFEKDLLAKLDLALEMGALDDLRDAGEQRWISGDMTLTRQQRRTYQYSDQTEALAMQLKEAQKAEQANGDAHCETKEFWRAVFK